MLQSSTRNAKERAQERLNLRVELDRLDNLLSKLKIEYEQYFSGIQPLAPDRLHNDARSLIRKLQKAPFRNSEMKFRLKALENRYNTFKSYWERVIRQREEGTYSRDVFKANLRERFMIEDERAQTQKGNAARGMEQLFNSYRGALEKQGAVNANVDFNSFQKAVLKRVKEFKAKHGPQKLAFRVVVKNGKVAIEAKAKEEEPS